jgi:hypothetical protein
LSPPDHDDFIDKEEIEQLNKDESSFMTLQNGNANFAGAPVGTNIEDDKNDLNDSFTNEMDMDIGPGIMSPLKRRLLQEKS